MWTRAIGTGVFAASASGSVPSHRAEGFAAAARAAGPGFGYHAGTATRPVTPQSIRPPPARGAGLANRTAFCIAAAGLLVMALIWMGPETRGGQFHARD